MSPRTDRGIDPTKRKDCGHTGTHHADDNGKRYCVVCRGSGKDSACPVIAIFKPQKSQTE